MFLDLLLHLVGGDIPFKLIKVKTQVVTYSSDVASEQVLDASASKRAFNTPRLKSHLRSRLLPGFVS